MKSGASARLKEERGRLGLSQVELGKLGGVSKNTQMAYENGSSPITLEYLTLVASHGVDVDYVFLGGKGGPPSASTPPSDDTVAIAQIDLRYGLGTAYLDSPVEVEKRSFSRAWLNQFTHTPSEYLFWAAGDGDSMEPTIRSGEIVLIDTSQTTPRMSEGIWAVALGDFGMIKRLHYAGRDGLQLVSDNQLIPPIVVAEDELHIIGRVVATMRRL